MRQPSNNPSVTLAYQPKKKKKLSVTIKKLKKAKKDFKKIGGLNFLVQPIQILLFL